MPKETKRGGRVKSTGTRAARAPKAKKVRGPKTYRQSLPRPTAVRTVVLPLRGARTTTARRGRGGARRLGTAAAAAAGISPLTLSVISRFDELQKREADLERKFENLQREKKKAAEPPAFVPPVPPPLPQAGAGQFQQQLQRRLREIGRQAGQRRTQQRLVDEAVAQTTIQQREQAAQEAERARAERLQRRQEKELQRLKKRHARAAANEFSTDEELAAEFGQAGGRASSGKISLLAPGSREASEEEEFRHTSVSEPESPMTRRFFHAATKPRAGRKQRFKDPTDPSRSGDTSGQAFIEVPQRSAAEIAADPRMRTEEPHLQTEMARTMPLPLKPIKRKEKSKFRRMTQPEKGLHHVESSEEEVPRRSSPSESE